MNLAEAPTLVADLLDEVCQARETRSAVTLAIALVDRGRLTNHGDPVGLLVAVLEDLNDAGLVTYRLRSPTGTIPLAIRATPLGYKLAGYERETPEVGSLRAKRGRPLHLGPTDFRSLPDSTTGGAIERMSLADHLDLYPERRSIHPHPWECGPYRGDFIMTRPRVDHTARVVAALTRLGGSAGWGALNEELGGVESTTHRILHQALDEGIVTHDRGGPWRLVPSPDRSVVASEQFKADIERSSREVILSVLNRYGEQPDDRWLLKAMTVASPKWRSLGMHSLDHQLFSMQKAGLIEMEVKREGSVQRITRIRLPKRGLVPVVIPEVEVEERHIVTIPVAISEDAPSVMEPILDVIHDRFPILASLRASAIERDETNRRADAYLSAASALDGVDQDESDRLMALANALASGIQISAVGAEYLRFAEETERFSKQMKDQDNG